MIFQLQPASRPAQAASSAPASTGSVARARIAATALAPVERPSVPRVRIARVEVEGCNVFAPSGVREGFQEAWREMNPAAAWNGATGDSFARPLAVDIPARISGRELGRKLAEAIFRRVEKQTSAR